MFSQLVNFIRIKFSYGLLFELVNLFRKLSPYRNSESEMVINPTFNLKLLANIVDRNSFDAIRGIDLSTGTLPIEQRVFYNLLISIAKCKNDPVKEQSLLATVPPFIRQIMQHTDILVKRDSSPKTLKYIGNIQSGDTLKATSDEVVNKSAMHVNPFAYLQTSKKIPQEVSEKLINLFKNREFDVTETFDLTPPLVWTVDPGNDFLSPFALTKQQSEVLHKLTDGELAIQDLDPVVLQYFLDIDVIVDFENVEHRRARFAADVEDCKAQLQKNHYVVLKSSFNKLRAASQKNYFSSLVKGGYFQPSDMQVPNRQFIHNEAYCRFLHFQINHVISQIVDEDIMPSYSYLANYYGGAELKKHIDREQCEWNVSMPLGGFPESDSASNWPIFIQTDVADPESKVEINLDVGDVVIYRGSRLYHWRNQLEAGREVTICFFHFVNRNFSGSLD